MTHVPIAELPQFVDNVRTLFSLAAPKSSATVLYLEGEVGAGKTTFMQTLARALGVEESVQSPTYVLMKSYTLPEDRLPHGARRKFNRLVHIDAYRLERPEEFIALRPEQFLDDPQTLVCVEWPDRLKGRLPPPDLTLRFSSQGAKEDERYIEMV